MNLIELKTYLGSNLESTLNTMTERESLFPRVHLTNPESIRRQGIADAYSKLIEVANDLDILCLLKESIEVSVKNLEKAISTYKKIERNNGYDVEHLVGYDMEDVKYQLAYLKGSLETYRNVLMLL